MHTPTQPRPRVPMALIAGAVIIALVPIVGVLAWLIWIAPLFVEIMVGLAAAGAIAHIWARVVVYLRRNQHRYIQAEHVERVTLAHRSQGLPATVQSLSYHDSHKELPAPPLALPEPNTVDNVNSIP